jgi:tRNA pseudouridine55 synthase
MIHGVLLLDKPKNISSNKALFFVKKILSPKKAGIVGILDPLASGMLPIVLNEGTKLAKYIENKDKDYLVVAKLGYKSTTGDAEGIITSTHMNVREKITEVSLNSILDNFVGQQEQVPPMYSGLKVNGIKLYKLARQGISIDRKPRMINVYSLNVISINDDEITIKISCSKGTYIRTLIESIGDYLGVGAYTKELRRLKVGTFEEKNMITIDGIINNQNLILPIDDMIGDMDSVLVTLDELKILRFGQPIHTEKYKNIEEIAIKNPNSNLVGIGKIIDNYIYPKRLMNFDE